MQRACVLIAVLAFLAQGMGKPEQEPRGLKELAAQAVSSNETVSDAAIAELRARGPAGLDTLFEVHAGAIGKALNPENPSTDEDDSTWQRLRRALDNVGGQRDCHAARLFWHTDFGQAQAVARQEHKPILSLRMLGKLTDEYSCANSRFFRSTLYSNTEVSRLLRERFVLHWQMVRPVPTVTVDFGDGRKIVNTVTGNSAHYILTADGEPVDALPGLYGPRAFMRHLEQAGELARAVMAEGVDRPALLADYHVQRGAELEQEWRRDLAKLDDAREFKLDPQMTPEKTSDELWSGIALLHIDNAALDGASRNLIASRFPPAAKAAGIAVSKRVVEQPLVRLVRQLQGTIAIDTVRNEYLLHRRIHEWFAAGEIRELGAFNERVYAELFLTPSNDPWLGLLPSAYTGLENDGVVAGNR